MSQLPEITQSIVKTLLTTNHQDNAEDAVVNAIKTQSKLKHKDALQQVHPSQQLVKQEVIQQTIDAKNVEDESLAKMQFLRYQKQKLKLLYPGFVEKAIEAAALSAWDCMGLEEKETYLSKLNEDVCKIEELPQKSRIINQDHQEKKSQHEIIELKTENHNEHRSEGNTKDNTEQNTDQNNEHHPQNNTQDNGGVIQELKIEHQPITSTNNGSSSQTPQQESEGQQSQSHSQNASNQLSTNLPLKNDQSHTEVTVQKYILIECRQTIDEPNIKQYSAIIISEKDANVDINDTKNHMEVVLTKTQNQCVDSDDKQTELKETGKQVEFKETGNQAKVQNVEECVSSQQCPNSDK